MRALVKKEARPGLWMDDVPVPAVGINDVLIKVRRTAICGTDMHIYNWDEWAQKTIPVPMVVGHEFVGEIVEIGSNVIDFKAGQVVSGEGHVVCGRCRNCMAGRRHLCANTSGIGVNRPGAFAEYVVLPMSNVWEHRSDIDLDIAALFDPLGNAVHTALQFDLLGEDVLITGAGPIGAMSAAVCRHAGARHVVITDVIDERLALAKRLGATRTVNVTRETLDDVKAELGMHEGFDVGLEMSGNPQALDDQIAHLCHGGKIAMLGIPSRQTPIDWSRVIFNMLTLKGIYGREMYETWYKMSVMIESGLDIAPVITHRLPFTEFESGFKAMNDGQASKVVLNWDYEPKLKDWEKIMYGAFQEHLQSELKDIREAGLFKREVEITSAQGTHVAVASGQDMLNLCANNYLGLAQHPAVNAAAARGLAEWGYGMASVRFICGTQTLHKSLEAQLSLFLGVEDCILYPSGFDANGGLFETLLGEKDAVISDALNHASIIDGVRLCKAQRYRYANNDMAELEAQLKAAVAAGTRFRLITTDGVFSMDGSIARLDEICDLADRYDALVHFDDCHATGFLGASGRGTHEYRGCMDRVDIITGTLGKALGGASGGFTAARREVVELLRQRSRPYLFSNTVAPPVVAGALKALQLVDEEPALREQLAENTRYFRAGLEDAGFELLSGEHPIIPVMFHDAQRAADMAAAIRQAGVYVVAFSFPVVPRGQARIRTQMSAALTRDDLDRAIAAFVSARESLS